MDTVKSEVNVQLNERSRANEIDHRSGQNLHGGEDTTFTYGKAAVKF